jgi:hypothetical protein
MPRYDLTQEQIQRLNESADPYAIQVRTLAGMYHRHPDAATLGLLDAAVEDFQRNNVVTTAEKTKTKLCPHCGQEV